MPVEVFGASLAERTTLRLGGPARRLVTAATESEVVDLVASADAEGEAVLVLGGGSNIVVSDGGFDGLVIPVETRGVELRPDDAGMVVTVQAGEEWDAFVARTVADRLVGVEALSGIPGRVGAAPIQNIGAYGQEVSQTIVAVRAYDRANREVLELSSAGCGFTYRNSIFKGSDRYVVLGVTFRLVLASDGPVVRYAELARRLGVEVGERAPSRDVRAAVLELRRTKGMVLDPDDHDTWSVGSFFTNPVLPAEDVARLLPPEAPRWPEVEGRTKVSAAWLIEQSGFGKGYGDGPVKVSSKHTLAITNRGGASTAELLSRAREIRDGVRVRFGIELEPEPVLVGCTL